MYSRVVTLAYLFYLSKYDFHNVIDDYNMSMYNTVELAKLEFEGPVKSV